MWIVKKKGKFVCEISIIIISLICQKLGLVRLMQQNIMLPSPNNKKIKNKCNVKLVWNTQLECAFVLQ